MNESPPQTRRGAVAAWILYDVAMHGYSLMIPGVAYAIYFTSHVAGDSGHADVLWSVAVSLSLVIAGLLAPWVGAASDETGRRRSLLGAATVLCGGASALLVVVIGGLGSFRGAVAGSLVLGFADAFGAQMWPGLAKFTPWIVMVAVLLWRPEGLVQDA